MHTYFSHFRVTRSENPANGHYKRVVLPENKVKDIWVVQGRDSTEVSTEEGTFNVNVRPGTWKLIIYTTQGLRQYKELDNIETLEGKKIDLGTISLD